MDFARVTRYLDDALIFGIKPSLTRIEKILELMGDPQKDIDHIHIVGTNGKTSTAIMAAGILKKMGFKAAYHISPHIDSYAERIWLEGSNITEKRFAAAFNKMHPLIEEVNRLDLGGPITQFEIISALAFMIAGDEKIDVMVLEAGMGGRWDATNAADALVAGLTGISHEHTEILGDTIEKIASEKVEVIKTGARAATLSRDEDVLRIFKEKADRVGAEYYIYGRDFRVGGKRSLGLAGWEVDIEGLYGSYKGIRLPLLGDYQPLNLSLAACLAELYMDIKGEKPDPLLMRDSLSDIYIKGRFEIISDDPPVIADASHNPEGIVKFCQTLEKYFSKRKKTVIFAVLADKDHRQMIGEVLKAADRLILTSSGSPRSLNLDRLNRETADIIKKNSGVHKLPGEIYMIDTIENSLNYALKISGSNDIICITGSITNLERIDGMIDKE